MIGIFDSGIGGITVFKEILKLLPDYQYIYYSDSYHNPYGNKTIQELNNITKNIITYLINKGCDIIVIACNTASLNCKTYLRSIFNIPIIAIEPAYKMIYDLSYNSSTLIMGTYNTVNSLGFKNLLTKYNNKKTTVLSCDPLATLIENKKDLEIDTYLKEVLTPYIGVEAVVLGCTHYPLIKDKIMSILGPIKFYDGSIGVAKNLKNKVQELNIKPTKLKITFIDSSNNKLKEKRFWEFLNN